MQIECSASKKEILFFFMALAREKNDSLNMYYMEESDVEKFVKNTFSNFKCNPIKNKYFPINLRTSQKGRLRFLMAEFCNRYGSKSPNEIKKYAAVLKHSFEIFKDDNLQSLINNMQIKKGPIEKNRIPSLPLPKKKGGGRPTKEEQERKRIAGLLAEGKGPDGELLSRLLLNPKGVCKYCSSTFEITHGSQKFCPERNGKKNLCSNRYNNAKSKKERDSKKKKEINPREVEKVLNDAKKIVSIQDPKKKEVAKVLNTAKTLEATWKINKINIGVRACAELKHQLTKEAQELGLSLSEYSEKILINRNKISASKISKITVLVAIIILTFIYLKSIINFLINNF